MTRVIGYVYEAGFHCDDCTRDRFPDPDAPGMVDREGNGIGAMFSTDESGPLADTCDDCGAILREGWLADAFADAARDARSAVDEANHAGFACTTYARQQRLLIALDAADADARERAGNRARAMVRDGEDGYDVVYFAARDIAALAYAKVWVKVEPGRTDAHDFRDICADGVDIANRLAARF